MTTENRNQHTNDKDRMKDYGADVRASRPPRSARKAAIAAFKAGGAQAVMQPS